MLAQNSVSAPSVAADTSGQPLLLGGEFGTITEVQTGALSTLIDQKISARQYGVFPFNKDRCGFLYRLAPQSPPVMRPVEPATGLTLDRLPTRAHFGSAVGRVAAKIAAGSEGLNKVVLARSLVYETDVPIDPMQVALLLSDDKNVLCYCIPLMEQAQTKRWLVGATPERLLKKQGASVLSTPLAGSARRCADETQDAEAGAALLRSDKDKTEHRIVVDYIHDILAPYCKELDTPARPELMRTKSMWHLGTRISGELRDPDTPCLELLEALHPTPAVAGAPLDLALSEIKAAEPFDRGFYAGTLGWVDDENNGDWHVTLRCAIIEDRRAQLFAGAGIVGNSHPEEETAETAAKFLAMRRALGISGVL